MRLDLGGPYRITRTWTGDHILYNPRDQYVGRSFDAYGGFSEGELRFLLGGTAGSHTIIDVGANIGAFTVPLARRAARVVAIEPQRLPFQVMCANLAINGLTNVLAIHAAAGSVAGQEVTIPAYDPMEPLNFGGVSVGGETGEKVAAVRLDDLPLDRVDMVKIDVEGMERDVLMGARGLIDQHKPALYIENDRPEKSEALIAAVLGMGYRAYWHLPPLYSPQNASGNAENLFPNLVSINMICWHESDVPAVAEKIEPNRVNGPEDTWERFRQVPRP